MEKIQPLVSNLPNISENSTLCKVLLYGNKTLNPAQNKEILNTTLTYICNTGRFNRETET